MKYGYLPGIDKPISRIVQGAMILNSRDMAGSFAMLDAVFEQGCTCIDTAHVYGDADRVLGQWVRERDLCDKVVILAKGAHHNQDRRRVTPWDIAADLHDTLARMQLPSVDLYVLHRDDPSVPVGPIVEALNEHKAAGRISAFGGSNWSHQRIHEANEYAAAHGLVPFAVSNPNLSLAEEVEEPWAECISIGGKSGAEARAFYQSEPVAIFSWSSLAGGFFSGRLNRANEAEFKAAGGELAIRCYASDVNYQRLDRCSELAGVHNCTIPQVALAWVMNQPLDVYALVGCRTPDEFRANDQALDILLTPAELAYLNLESDSPA